MQFSKRERILKVSTLCNNSLIVHSRDLANSTWGMDINALRVLNLALSKVDSRQPNPGRIYLETSDYVLAYGVNKRHAFGVMREAVERLVKASIKLDFPDVPEEIKYHEINWLDEGGFDNGKVMISFSKKVEEYLFEIKERFVKLRFDEIRKIDHSFAFRLYQYLMQHETNPANQKTDGYFEVCVDLMDVYKMCPERDSTEQWKRLSEKVICPAIRKINESQPVHFAYEAIKNGRTVTGVKFLCLVEKVVIEKPKRPRLKRRPKCLAGSSMEGAWARENLTILKKYFSEFARFYGVDFRSSRYSEIPLRDFQIAAEMCQILGEPIPKFIEFELMDRSRAKR
ncbi:TPA: replication initiation protein [Vibrio cholerae]